MNYFCNRVQQLSKAYEKEREIEREMGMSIYESFEDYVKSKTKKELQMWRIAKEMYNMVKVDEPVWYLVTIRPDSKKIDDIDRFVKDVEFYVDNLPYEEYMYAFEQKGENLEEAGKGFHVHILFCTRKVNYYISHILRDVKRKKYSFINYTAANCIQIDKVNCKERAVQYISGDKKDDKKDLACQIDVLWREKVGLKAIVRSSRSSPDESL